MGDHFVLLVDRLLTESTLEAAIQSRKQAEALLTIDAIQDSDELVVECRICQDEDFDSNMEVPCSCTGSLKYAHRRCVQRWCNEKGDTLCEICHQQFKPGYTAPPPVFCVEGLSMNLRGNWQIATREDINNGPQIITMVSTQRRLLNSDYQEFSASTWRSIDCCRSVAIIFMILLIMRHTLPVLVSQAGRGSYSFPHIMLIMLRIAGIVLPICIILKAVTSLLRHRHLQQVVSAQ